jgi:hypothetical protein
MTKIVGYIVVSNDKREGGFHWPHQPMLVCEPDRALYRDGEATLFPSRRTAQTAIKRTLRVIESEQLGWCKDYRIMPVRAVV